MERIKQIYDYYKFLLDNKDKLETFIDSSIEPYLINKYYVSYLLYTFIRDLYEKNKFPQVIDDKEYEKINAEKLYHGFEEFDYAANFLCDYNFHQGHWMYGNGFYFDSDYDVALYYASSNSELVMEIKILSDNAIKKEELECLVKFIKNDKFNIDIINTNKIKNNKEVLLKIKEIAKDDETFLNLITEDLSKLAIMLGYDYVEDFDQPIVLNRNIVAVKKSDYERFCEKSNSYKGGYVNIQRGDE